MLQYHFMKLVVHTDGGSRGNPGPGAAGFTIRDSTGKMIASRGIFIGSTTNNQAEYLALINAMIWIRFNLSRFQMIPSQIICHLDSLLAVRQLGGNYKIKALPLRDLADKVKRLEREINIPFQYRHIPREENSSADKLVNRVLDSL